MNIERTKSEPDSKEIEEPMEMGKLQFDLFKSMLDYFFRIELEI